MFETFAPLVHNLRPLSWVGPGEGSSALPRAESPVEGWNRCGPVRASGRYRDIEGRAARLAAARAAPMSGPQGVTADRRSDGVERLLCSFGDDRILIQGANGTNAYGSPPAPVPGALLFSSCTASPPSKDGFRAAREAARAIFASPAGVARATARGFDQARARLARAFALPAAESFFAASATDAELLCMTLFWAARPDAPITNLFVGGRESGRGSMLSGSARHFNSLAPSGLPVATGAEVFGNAAPFGRPDVLAIDVPLRDSAGEPRRAGEVDEHVKALVDAALADGRRVLVHRMAASKTGLQGPSEDVLRELSARGAGDVEVVVDAAQGRFRRGDPSRWLSAGFSVITSGSKFFGGPAFSGVLIRPGASRAATIERLTRSACESGLAAYLSAGQMPSTWSELRARLPSSPSLGLLARWEAALPSIERLAAHDEAEVEAALQAIERALFAAVSSLPGVRHAEAHRGIVSFGIESSGASLALASLRDIVRGLRGASMEGPVYLGEPLCLAGTSAPRMRAAVAARHVCRVLDGGSCDDELESFRRRLRHAIAAQGHELR
jgi:hypothetical protein